MSAKILVTLALVGMAVAAPANLHGGSHHGGVSHGGSHVISHGGLSHGVSHGGLSHGVSHGGLSHGGLSHGVSHGGLSHGVSHGGLSHGVSHGGLSHGVSHGGLSHGVSHGASQTVVHGGHGGGYQDDYKSEPMPYHFGYGVSDDYTGNNFGQTETSDGHSVKGSYHVQLPDGRKQIVNYVADHYGGYRAEVTYEGEAQYPTYHPQPSYH